MKSLKILFTALKQYSNFRKFSGLSNDKKNQSSIPQLFVKDIIKLGPVFIKFGQILSTRSELLPHQYILALQKLQENVPAMDFKKAIEVIETELKKPAKSLFKSIDSKPVASASLAQVHFATLLTGEKIAIKIQKSGIHKSVKRDINRLEKLLGLFNFFIAKKLQRINALNGFAEFKRYTLQELDYIHEGKTIERFATNFKQWQDIIFPHVYWQLSTTKLLCMSRVEGMRLGEAVNVLSTEKKIQLNSRLAELELKMFITDGLFHADLHPGNIFFKRDGKIALLDFGMYGELSKEERNRFVLYWLAVVHNDIPKAFYHFKKQCIQLDNANEASFFQIFENLANKFYNSRLKDASITQIYIKMIQAGYQYGFYFPANLLLHAKALTTAEALSFDLAPDARFEKITKPILIKEISRLVLQGDYPLSILLSSMPELMLTGEIAKVTNQEQSHNFELLAQLLENFGIEQLKNLSKNTALLFILIKKPAQKELQRYFNGANTEKILAQTISTYKQEKDSLLKQQSIGATLTLNMACFSVAFYRSLIENGMTKEKAIDVLYNICWEIYQVMAEIPAKFANTMTNSAHDKMRFATQLFRLFPFSSPDYRWKDVKADKNTVAFDCQQCRVAEYFIQHNLGDVCYQTWCKLDFPLAQKWGGKLERKGSIANGNKCCDFRWKTQ